MQCIFFQSSSAAIPLKYLFNIIFSEEYTYSIFSHL